MKAFLMASGCLVLLAGTSGAAPVDYVRDVKPILSAQCVSCHGADRAKAGLRLDTGAAILKGTKSGPVVVPGKSADSPLFQCLTPGGDTRFMPPKGPALAKDQVNTLKTWIDEGAKVPANEPATVAVAPGKQQERRGPGEGRGRKRESEREKEKREQEREKEKREGERQKRQERD